MGMEHVMNTESEIIQELFDAVESGDVAAARAILESGVDVDVLGPTGASAAMWAASFGRAKCLRMLIEQGADVMRVRDKDGNTALTWAACGGHLDCLDVILDSSVEIDAIDNDGKTAAMWASETAQDACLARLIAAGADLQMRNNMGETAAIIAAVYGNRECLRVLVDSGVDLEREKDAAGRSALKIARENELEDVAAYWERNRLSDRSPREAPTLDALSL